ncbi:MAG TPA: hypothetical protein VNG31_03875 [Candidatus Baltobacteraceae bacterium]|nr:hypothetical protein [Candidatus Baltobacteraceae bacterium]
MHRIATLAALACALFLAGTQSLLAQIPEPTPPPDPHVYSDAAMNFKAPADAYLVGRGTPPLAQLGENLQTVAEWVIRPGKEDQRMIVLSMEAFSGPPDQWEAQFESQTHSAGDGVLIRGKTPMSLVNGMPANFVEITSGSGFQAHKQYAVVWADGQRGISLSLITRIGDVTAAQAKEVLHDVTAVRYPVDRP